MKKVYAFVFIPIAFFALILFIPTSKSKNEILNGYQSTVQFSSSSMAYSYYLSQFEDVQNNSADIGYANTVRNNIASLAAGLCEKYGNGGSMEYTYTQRKQGQFRYSLALSGGKRVGYNTRADMQEQLKRMSTDPNAVGYISCCGFALFCWDTMLLGDSFYTTMCEVAIHTYFQDIIEGDGTLDYIKQHAKPGDLLFYTDRSKDVGSPPVKATMTAGENYTHVEVFLGSYSGVDAQGTSYQMEYACAGSNEPNKNRDACIKTLESTVSPRSSKHKAIYLVSLDKWIASGYKPSNLENTSDVLTYAQECPP